MRYFWLIVGVLMAGYCILAIKSNCYNTRLRRSRKDLTLEDFVNEFDENSIDRSVLEMAYSDLFDFCRMPIHRLDRFKDTLRFLPEELDMMVEERCRKLGISDIYTTRFVELFPIVTIEDYVKFISAVKNNPPHQP